MSAQEVENQIIAASPQSAITPVSAAASPPGGWADESIKTAQEDRFGFKAYAQVLADQALKADTPVIIGIYGRWGSGKTSLMRLMQDHIVVEQARQIAKARHKPRQKDGLGCGRVIWLDVWQLGSQA